MLSYLLKLKNHIPLKYMTTWRMFSFLLCNTEACAYEFAYESPTITIL